MRAERLFRVLGLVDPALVEEALAVRRRAWRHWVALAACLALVVSFGWAATGGFQGYGGGMSGSSSPGSTAGGPSADSGSSGGEAGGYAGPGENGGADGCLSFHSYAGPVFPLTAAEAPEGLTAERTVTWDFSLGAYPDGEPRQWGAEVTDAYVLYNGSEADMTLTALYPFAGSFSELALPAVTVDGEAREAALYAGPYSGGFQSTLGAETPDTMNLDTLSSWREYKALLESGAYQAQGLGEAPALEMPVTVYEFSDFAAPHDRHPAATQAISFDIDPEKTTILTYGINGLEWDGSFRRYSYFVPDGVRNERDLKLLIVLGEDIGPYTLQGFEDGGCDPGEEIEGVSCAVTRTETTLDTVLDRLCADSRGRSARNGEAWAEGAVSPELYRKAVAEMLSQYGPVSGAVMDRYADGRLDDLLQETPGHDRVLYLRFPVTVPAGESVRVECAYWKAPSFDFGGSGSENEGLQGYDLVTALGSGLTFTRQSAALVNMENVELTGQNLGLEGGVTAVELDLAQEHYYLEIRPREE